MTDVSRGIQQGTIGGPTPDLPRRVGFWGAVAIMMGVVIGSGIFQTPPVIAQHLGSPWIILSFWLVAGLIALCGALTFAEIASKYPSSGGIYVFLREGFGPRVAFVFGWTYTLITKPAAAGGIVIVFADHWNALFGLDWSPPLLTCGILILLTLINVLGVRGSTRVAVVLTALKFGALALIVVIGVGAALAELAGWRAAPEGVTRFAASPVPTTLLAAITPVMAAIMWTYDGWSDVGSIAGEVRDPARMLPRIYLWGTLAVIGLYLLANAVYLWHIPLEEMRKAETVAPLLVDRLVGPAGAVAVTAMILISTIGASHASIMTGARVTFAQARDGLFFRFIGRVSERYETPAVALWVQCALSCIVVLLLRDFASLAGSFVFTMWIFYGLAAIAIFVLRRRETESTPTFRVPFYPVVPTIFIAASAAMTVLSIIESPRSTLPWLGLLLAGVPAYSVWRAVTASTYR
jgi:basic amino acid/polyamine antiporter, APA family